MRRGKKTDRMVRINTFRDTMPRQTYLHEMNFPKEFILRVKLNIYKDSYRLRRDIFKKYYRKYSNFLKKI